MPGLALAQSAPQKQALPSKAFRYKDMQPSPGGGPLSLRQILLGPTHSGYALDLHESELPAGQQPHPPHHHVHEEVLMIREGTLDVTILGKTTRLGPGSVAYLASNDEHGWRNVGTTTARYFVFALGGDKA